MNKKQKIVILGTAAVVGIVLLLPRRSDAAEAITTVKTAEPKASTPFTDALGALFGQATQRLDDTPGDNNTVAGITENISLASTKAREPIAPPPGKKRRVKMSDPTPSLRTLRDNALQDRLHAFMIR